MEFFGTPNDDSSGSIAGFYGPLLKESVLPTEPPLLIADDLREAYRSLKGRPLRKEVFAEDESLQAKIPYTVTETNYTVTAIQPTQDANLHSVYLVIPRETLTHHFERVIYDPRVSHTMTLEFDTFGNPLKTLNIAYGRTPNATSLTGTDKNKQETTLLVYSEFEYTNFLDTEGLFGHYRLPTSAEERRYELTGLAPTPNSIFSIDDLSLNGSTVITTLAEIQYEDDPTAGLRQKRLIHRSRAQFRDDNLSGVLPVGQVHPMALPGYVHVLTFTPGLLSRVYQRQVSGGLQALIPNQKSVLSGTGDGQAGYIDLDSDGHLWKPSHRAWYHPSSPATPDQELAEAKAHFFRVRRFTDPFGATTTAEYDLYNMLPMTVTDPVQNVVVDYRTLKPSLITDPNGNRKAAVYDALGFPVAMAVMGKYFGELG